MSEVYVSSVHIKIIVQKPLDTLNIRYFAYKEIKSKYAHKSAVPYITWGLIQDTKKGKERTTRIFLNGKEMY